MMLFMFCLSVGSTWKQVHSTSIWGRGNCCCLAIINSCWRHQLSASGKSILYSRSLSLSLWVVFLLYVKSVEPIWVKFVLLPASKDHGVGRARIYRMVCLPLPTLQGKHVDRKMRIALNFEYLCFSISIWSVFFHIYDLSSL